ncbi:centrosomal protein CCDC61 isoform X2 [Zootoca vivipara]|uniref:centrosomal protein CCDC61 isoform X2 n=1 Tax=Zootoca vivipara TaxID=8524 RepID=UPI0015915D79|nr:centrosomal protein CCDC61 isoform X2 [Zootoca vivipara]
MPCETGIEIAGRNMAKLHGLQADYVFRGVEHIVRMSVDGNLLEVEVEDRLTTDQWRGEFDAAFIEDLTHKTGNFKQFGIFCSMLESALSQSSESVTLDLLTYTDLESLRNRKIGVGPRHMAAAKNSPLSSKRYLILIYSVEFDRLQHTLEEKQSVETVLLGLQEELKLTNKSSAFKEVKILKKVVQSLEEELTKEKAKHQRLTNKRLQESRQLADELAEMKATERSLRIRVKNLTNELALYKKGRFTPSGPSPQNHPAPPRNFAHPTLSRGSTKKKDVRRSTSEERSNSRERSGAWGPSRQRSTSREGHNGSQGRLPRQSPSPTGPRAPRFDPTAFVKAKERKQKEAEQKKERCLRRGMGDTPPSGWCHRMQSRGPSAFSTSGLGKSRGRSSSVESFRSRRSSASSGSELDDYSEPAAPRGRKRAVRGRKPLSSSSWNGSTVIPHTDGGHRKHLASTPTTGLRADKENLYDEPAADLSEIDARLQALQEYMNKLETRT